MARVEIILWRELNLKAGSGIWKDHGEGPGGVYSWFGEGSRIYSYQGRACGDLQCGNWAWVPGDAPGVLGSECQVLIRVWAVQRGRSVRMETGKSPEVSKSRCRGSLVIYGFWSVESHLSGFNVRARASLGVAGGDSNSYMSAFQEPPCSATASLRP